MYRLQTIFMAGILVVSLTVSAGAISIVVAEPSGVARTAWPVTSGIPFGQGVLQKPGDVALFDEKGNEIPLQTETLARWPDGSIRWLLLDFQIDLQAKQRRVLDLRYGKGIQRKAVVDPVSVEERDGQVVVDTGPMELRLGGKSDSLPSGGLLGTVSLDLDGDGKITKNERILDAEDVDILLTDTEGQEFRLGSPTNVLIEQAGPIRACVRLEGKHVSQKGSMFRYIVRLHAYRGQPFVKCYYTFINDQQKSLMASVRELNLKIARPKAADEQPADNWCIVDEKLYTDRPSRGHESVVQWDESHYNRNGKPAGRRAAGWAALGVRRAGVAVGLREFWQNWPKSAEIEDDTLAMGICPALPKGLYAGKPLEEENKLYYHVRDGVHSIKTGTAKTHELWLRFLGGRPDIDSLSHFYQATEDPLPATCDPQYVCKTKAAGNLRPADPKKYFGYDAWLERALNAHLEQRDKEREYGMLNYGDWFGERKVNWGNLEYDLAHGLFLQYLRSGNRECFLRAEQAARHHIDVDVIHATNPLMKNPWGAPPKVGEMWLHCLNHTGGYYKDGQLPVSHPYHMGHSTNFGHVWLTGDLEYYYLTGDRRAREVVMQMADAMAAHMPTRYGTHIRVLGWPIIMMLSAYELSGEQKYLDAATLNWQVLKKNIDWNKGWVVRLAGDHCRHGDRRCHGNVPFMEGLTLCALARYHRATGNPEVLKAISVGIDQMIRECWEDDVKTFRYTACPLSQKTSPVLFMLSTEAMAYEVSLTGNVEHMRILREGFQAAIPKDDRQNFGKNLAQMIYFSPHAMAAIDP
ncbi:MAG: hypothetical protein JXM70_26700 [Pirellulales bacterium]|nr:hypothetical protein [Pirellulales bacterium]